MRLNAEDELSLTGDHHEHNKEHMKTHWLRNMLLFATFHHIESYEMMMMMMIMENKAMWSMGSCKYNILATKDRTDFLKSLVLILLLT